MTDEHDEPKTPEAQEQEEREEAEEVSRVTQHVMYEVVRQEGELELSRPTSALWWSSLAAGLSMGFSLLCQALIKGPLPEAPWATLLSRFGYTVGFVLVVLGRQQLFTENTLTGFVPLLADRSGRTLGNVARLWSVVLVGNLLGTFLFALALTKLHVFPPDITHQLGLIAHEAVQSAALATFIKAIFAGWLIAMMVWMLPSAVSPLVIVVLVTYFIGLAHLAHIIGGSAEAFYAMFNGSTTVTHGIFGWLLPTLAGNVIGGCALVAAVNHAQVVADRQANA